MSLEGLDYVLQKKEVIPTVSAQDLLNRAEQVDADYLRHVRTYIPLSRVAQGQEGQLNVEDFERKLIRQVKEAQAPRGYLTANYGYGKTSTALYLWQRAEEASLVVVPPFQLLELPDLVHATHGWVRYKLQHRRPDLVPALDQLYTMTVERTVEREAREKNVRAAVIQEWIDHGRLILDLTPADYIGYFEKVTDIVQQGGFGGLVVLPDEIQQYFEPKIALNVGDPIAPFFNLIQGLATRAGHLRFGFVMVIPLKEVGVIREARGRDDLLHRMRELSLDLSSIYDPEFATRLWNQFADVFEFGDHKYRVVQPETLLALGEITARDDLSDGPRTVINVFRRMVERYKRADGFNISPYSPIDLADDLLNEQAIQFVGDDKIRKEIRRALQTAIVRGNSAREDAVKLVAVFPTNGAPAHIQQQYGVTGPLKELMQGALGELVMAVGPLEAGGITLVGLDRAPVSREWLPQTIRELRRAYREQLDITKTRALTVFGTLLKDQIFRNWRVEEERASSFTANQSIILTGDFPSFASRFPRRRVHLRILWEDEERKDSTVEGDVCLEYHLSLYADRQGRSRISEPLTINVQEHTVIVPINLAFVRADGIPLQIQQRLQSVWSPYELSPLVLMTIYQTLEEKREDHLLPKQEDQVIKNLFQPELLETISRNLFNAEVGAPLGAAGAAISEQAIGRLLELRYGLEYRTILAVQTWRDSFRKYTAALERLENRYQRRGDIEMEGSKKEIADHMVLSSTGLDSFLRTFDTLLTVTRDWPTRAQQDETGAVRFTLHPLEERVTAWLRESKRTERVSVSGVNHDVHSMLVSDVYKQARFLGYQDEEISALLDLLVTRELIEIHQKHLIREVPSQQPDIEGVADDLRRLEHQVTALCQGFVENSRLRNWREDIAKWQNAVEGELSVGTPDPQKVYRLGKLVQKRTNEVYQFADERRSDLQRRFTSLLRGLRPIRPDQIDALNESVSGSVTYVDQINVLRTSLRRQVDTVKGRVEQLRLRLEQAQASLTDDKITYVSLANLAKDADLFEAQLADVSSQITQFESQFQQFASWRRLVSDGSALSNQLEQMDAATIRVQQNAFDALVRDIRADISSRPLATKLDALPAYTLFEVRLTEISDQVRRIRTEAQDRFAELQNQYRHILTNSGLFRREQMGRAIEFNLSNPTASILLLHEDVQEKMLKLSEQMSRLIKDARQNVLVSLGSPQLLEISAEERELLEDLGHSSLQVCEQVQVSIDDLEEQARSLSTISDFPGPTEGQFAALVAGFVEQREKLAQIYAANQQLSGRLTQVALTPQEQIAFDQLLVDDIERGEDLIEWQRRVQLSNDDFWRALRGLYEKRRIRQIVSRIRS